MNDNVQNPSHYNNDSSIEAIDAIEASMSQEEFRGYLKGSFQKYVWRWDKKHTDTKLQVEDLKKAQWFLNKLIQNAETES